MSALSVHLNREKPREVDAPASFTAHEQFDIALENHGDGAAVHVQLDSPLSTVAQLGKRELRVGPGETKHVRVTVGDIDESVTGELTISLGYGVATGKTTITVEPPQPEAQTIQVDESLGHPRQQPTRSRPEPRTLGLIAFAGVALLVAAGVALTVESTIVLAAAVLVAIIAVVGVGAALY